MMGQFHSDFLIMKGHSEVPTSKHSIFLGKKLYVDDLIDSTSGIDYMVRGKGLTQECIKHEANKCGGYIKLYEKMLKFGSSSSTLNKNMTNEFKFKHYVHVLYIVFFSTCWGT